MLIKIILNILSGMTALCWSFLNKTIPASHSFSRASTGWVTNETGVLESVSADAPRFDYHPVTHDLLGIWIEKQATNLLTRSIPYTAWGKNNTNTAQTAGTAPNGANEAVSITETSDDGRHFITSPVVSITTGTTCTISGYFKKGTATVLQITANGTVSSEATANFDLDAGVLGAVSAAATASIQTAGNGWYRCTMTFTAVGSGSVNVPILALVNNDANAARLPSYTGTGQLLYAWGIQTEEGPTATSHIPTSGTAVTRAADTLSFTLPSGGASLLYVFDDNSAQNVSAGGGAYTVPTSLTRARLKSITIL